MTDSQIKKRMGSLPARLTFDEFTLAYQGLVSWPKAWKLYRKNSNYTKFKDTPKGRARYYDSVGIKR